MSSAFFRRPGDGSSSSSSDGDASEETDLPTQYTEDSVDVEGPIVTTDSLPSHRGASTGEDVDIPVTAMPNVEHHRTNLISALLEDFARTRASAFLNETLPGSAFDKSSPEVQPLAESVYQQVSQSLALTGILPATSDGDNKQERAAYIAGLESLALGNVQNHNLPPGQKWPQLLPPTQRLAAARTSSQQRGSLSPFPHLPISNPAFRQNQSYFSLQYPGQALVPQEARRSHYESSFRQLRLLGKGGFGRVYHAYNVFDKKEYAVKKIPLSPKLSQRYRESGHKEIENVLREVQALAQLEHNNVVRYHATWIEEPRTVLDMNVTYQNEGPSLATHSRRLIADRLRHTSPGVIRPQTPVPEHSDGVIFGNDSSPTTPARQNEESAHALMWSVPNSAAEPSSARPSEIFTDGNARPNVSETTVDDTVYVLHFQMSVYPTTLAQYLAPVPMNSRRSSITPTRRHCFHLVPALRILLGILCGLQYIHARGLIHRDVKPSNIFISDLDLSSTSLIPEGYHDVGSCSGCSHSDPYFVNPRIGDFGLVAELAKESGHDRPSSARKSAKVVGTEYYRPPQWTGPPGLDDHHSEVDEKVDIFALGVIFVELLWPCVTSTERMHVLRNIQKGEVPVRLSGKIDDEGYEPGLSGTVVACISGMIDREPRRRWSCLDVKEHVELLLKSCETLPIINPRHMVSRGLDLEAMSRVKSIDETTEHTSSLDA